MQARSFAAGAAVAIAGNALLPRLLRLKFERDVARLNGGDHEGLLAAYADDAVLRFAPGDHRWAGDWVGKPAIERFLRSFTAAGIQGEIKDVAVAGPPWALRMFVRFDDHADAPDGTRLYENRTALVVRTRWGRIVEQEDFYLDTARIADFDRALTALGVETVGR